MKPICVPFDIGVPSRMFHSYLRGLSLVMKSRPRSKSSILVLSRPSEIAVMVVTCARMMVTEVLPSVISLVVPTPEAAAP